MQCMRRDRKTNEINLEENNYYTTRKERFFFNIKDRTPTIPI